MTGLYDIEMKVPLGIRHGRMQIEEQDGNVSGFIRILGNTTKFQGTIEDNWLTIAGEFVICVRKIAYEGCGTMTERDIQLHLQSKNSVYELTGHRCEQEFELGIKEEEKQDENIL